MFMRSSTMSVLRHNLSRVGVSSGMRAAAFLSSHASSFYDAASSSGASSAPAKTNVEEGVYLQNLHQEFFTAPENASVYDIRSAAYTKLSDEDIQKYFPEGFAGELSAEFQFTKQSKWMIRDSTKLLCRLIDEVEPKLKKGTTAKQPQQQQVGLHSVVTLDRLTDRPEWEASTLQVSRFGKELAHSTEVAKAGDFVKSKGGQSALEKTIKAINEQGGIPDKIMLTGPRGSGKSVALNQVVLHARKRGWLCLFVPNGWEQVQSGPFVEPVSSIEGVYDNSIMTASVLRGFWKAHKDELKSLPIQNTKALEKYTSVLQDFREAWGRALSLSGRGNLNFIAMRAIIKGDNLYEDDDELDADILKNFDFLNFQPKTLEDYVLLGLALNEVAGMVFVDLVNELRNLESMPVLIAVDQYNTWQANSAFMFNNQAIVGKDICVPNTLQFLSTKKSETEAWKIKNGLCIGATSFKHGEGKKVTYENVKASLPLCVRMPTYNQVEYLSAMSYYLNFAAVDNSMSTEHFLQYRTHTASNPRIMRLEAVPFFFPRSIAANDEALRWAMLSSMSEEDSDDVASRNLEDVESVEEGVEADFGYDEEDDEDADEDDE